MSFTAALKKEAALDSTYTKGRNLARDGYVESCEVIHSDIQGVVRLSGKVEGSGYSSYRTNVTLDYNDESVIDFGCSCPASEKYYGMCKHEIALALWYLNDVGEERLSGSVARPVTASPKVPAAGIPARMKPELPSSPQITNLLASFDVARHNAAVAAQRARAMAMPTSADPVDFALTVTRAPSYYSYMNPGSDTTWQLKLRVCRGKASYVVKNMNQLVDAWEKGSTFSYGKNLVLAHVPSEFTQRACKLLDLLARVVRNQRALYLSRDRYWSAGSGTSVKELPLSPADIVEVLDLYQGEDIVFEPKSDYYNPKSPRTLRISDGTPQLEVSLEPHPDGGYDLRLPAVLECVSSGGAFYLFDKDKAWKCSEDFASQMGLFLSSVLPMDRPLHIHDRDLEGFCGAVLTTLASCTDLKAPDNLYGLVPPKPAFSFRVSLEDGLVICDARVRYADTEVGLYEETAPGRLTRDLGREYEVVDVVDVMFPYDDVDGGFLPCFSEDDAELMYNLLTGGLSTLSNIGEVFLSENLRGIEVRESPSVRVKATVRSGLLDLEVDSSNLSARELMEYLASYKRKQKFVRLSNGDIVRLDGGVRALADLADGLGIETEDLVTGVSGLSANRTLYVDALLKRTQGVKFDRDEGFRAIVRDFDSVADADFPVPAALADVLRNYQEEGFRWLSTLARFGFGGILADDMGLGKTLQVITYFLAHKEAGGNKPSLVVCPASLVYNWMAELERFAPQLSVNAVTGTKAHRTATIGGAGEYDVLVTSYDLMRRDVETYQEGDFHCVVLDEAQYIKNPGTQVAKCAKCLPSQVRFALTGTPIENRLSELWSIFDFLMPGILGTQKSFSERFAGPVEAREEGAAERLQCMVRPFVLRRLKGDILNDLPEKTESVVYAQMSGEQEKLYKANQDRLALQVAHELPDDFKKNKLQVLAELTKLRQICCDPHLFYENYEGESAKLETCLELVRNAVDGGHGVLLFSQFTSMLSIVAERLAKEKIGHFLLTGSTSKEERARLVERFQAGEVPVFLISLKAGGVGLNLTAADVVIHYDPWWNLAAQSQATDRAHRIGQTRGVSVFKLIAKGTIEERIVQMQESKRDLAESVLGGEGVGSAAISKEDVLALLGA